MPQAEPGVEVNLHDAELVAQFSMGRSSMSLADASRRRTPGAHVGSHRRVAAFAAARELVSRWLLALTLLFAASATVACGPSAPAPAPADPDAVIEVPVTVHVATLQGRPVVTDAEIVADVRRANRALAPFRMRVHVARMRTMGPGHDTINTEPERLELARRAHHDGTLHVFFVDRVSMREEDDADARLSGLHWRYAGMRTTMYQRQYLVIAQDAPNTTLAHEIGHAFGLEHHKSFENIMCSCRRGPDTFFTARQGEQLREGAVAWMNLHRR